MTRTRASDLRVTVEQYNRRLEFQRRLEHPVLRHKRFMALHKRPAMAYGGFIRPRNPMLGPRRVRRPRIEPKVRLKAREIKRPFWKRILAWFRGR